MKRQLSLAFALLIIGSALAIYTVVVAYSNVDQVLEKYHPYFFLAYLIIGLALRQPYQVAVAAGIVLLLITPLIPNMKEPSNQIVIYAFYFLSIGLIWAIADYVIQRWEFPSIRKFIRKR